MIVEASGKGGGNFCRNRLQGLWIARRPAVDSGILPLTARYHVDVIMKHRLSYGRAIELGEDDAIRFECLHLRLRHPLR